MEKAAAVDPPPQRRPQRHGERRGAPLGRRGDGRAGRAPSAVAARAAAADRVRGGRQPHAGQPVAARGRSADPRAGAGACRHRHAQARPRRLCDLCRAASSRVRQHGDAGAASTCPGSASTTTTATCRASAGCTSSWTAAARDPGQQLAGPARGGARRRRASPCCPAISAIQDPELRRVGGVLARGRRRPVAAGPSRPPRPAAGARGHGRAGRALPAPPLRSGRPRLGRLRYSARQSSGRKP